jgi:hypothetical protein
MPFRTSADPSRRPGLGVAPSFLLSETSRDLPKPVPIIPRSHRGGSRLFKRISAPAGARPWPSWKESQPRPDGVSRSLIRATHLTNKAGMSFNLTHILLATPRSIKDSLPAAGGRAAAGQDGVPGEGLHMVTVAQSIPDLRLKIYGSGWSSRTKPECVRKTKG